MQLKVKFTSFSPFHLELDTAFPVVGNPDNKDEINKGKKERKKENS